MGSFQVECRFTWRSSNSNNGQKYTADFLYEWISDPFWGFSDAFELMFFCKYEHIFVQSQKWKHTSSNMCRHSLPPLYCQLSLRKLNIDYKIFVNLDKHLAFLTTFLTSLLDINDRACVIDQIHGMDPVYKHSSPIFINVEVELFGGPWGRLIPSFKNHFYVLFGDRCAFRLSPLDRRKIGHNAQEQPMAPA